MPALSCTARVRDDGSISISEADRENLGLKAGDELELTLQNPGPEFLDPSDNPLLQIIGIAGKGGKADGGINHDKYLYGKKTP